MTHVAYITLLFEGGADVMTVQTLARHCDPRITMNLYARSRHENLFRAAETIGRTVILPEARTLLPYHPPSIPLDFAHTTQPQGEEPTGSGLTILPGRSTRHP